MLKLVQLPLSLAATLAVLRSISEIPFLDSCVPAFLIRFFEAGIPVTDEAVGSDGAVVWDGISGLEWVLV
jgi:hypothetical protein